MLSSIRFMLSVLNLLLITKQISCLDVLHSKANYIFTLEVIRNTSAILFDSLQLNRSNNTWRSFDSIRNLTSLTDKNYNSNEITECLFGCNKTNDKRTQNFITLINEILDEDPDIAYEEKETENDVDTFLNELQELRRSFDDYQIDSLDVKYFNRHTNSNVSLDTNNTSIYSDDDGGPNHRRIYRGERTKFKHYPFIAGILVLGQFQCAGSIIRNDLVITAASCVQVAYNNRLFRENPIILSVHVGSSFYQGGGEIIPVIEAFFYPSYVPKTLRHNICILRLQRKLELNKVRFIDYDRNATPLPSNVPTITVLGWGSKSHSNSKKSPWENILSFAHLDFYPLPECRDIYAKGYVNKENFCAGFMSKGGGACIQDVGGPGLVDGKLMGVISFGSPVCGAMDYPTVFTKLGYYSEWIDSIMDQRTPNRPMETTTISEVTHTNPPHYIKGINTFTVGPIIEPTRSTRQMIMAETEEETEAQTEALRENIGDRVENLLKESPQSGEVVYEDLVKDKNFVNNLLKYILKDDDPEKMFQPKPKEVNSGIDYESDVNNVAIGGNEDDVTTVDHFIPYDSYFKTIRDKKKRTTAALSGYNADISNFNDNFDVDLDILLKTVTTKFTKYQESRKHKENGGKIRSNKKVTSEESEAGEDQTNRHKTVFSDSELKQEIRKIISSGDVNEILKGVPNKRTIDNLKIKEIKERDFADKERLTLLYLSDENA